MVAKLVKRIFNKIEITGGFVGCWLWRGSLSTHGKHGRIKVNGKVCKVHRVMYSLVKGPCPNELVVRHMCHESRCCNPFHLALGTISDNVADSVEARRHVRRFSDTEVENIRLDAWKGASYERLSWDYDVSVNSIRKIVTYETYKYIQ
jgi:hypothetical protein